MTRISGRRAFTAAATPAISPPPDSCTTMCPDIRHRLDHLETERALARDDIRMVEGRDRHHALLGDQPLDLDLRIVLAAPDDAYLRPQRLDRRNLVARHQRRHADDRARARRARGMGQSAAVISGGGRDHAARPRRVVETRHRVRRTPQLEASGVLLVFQLEPDRNAGALRERGRRIDRRLPHHPRDTLPRRFDFGQADRHAGHGAGPAGARAKRLP